MRWYQKGEWAKARAPYAGRAVAGRLEARQAGETHIERRLRVRQDSARAQELDGKGYTMPGSMNGRKAG